MSVHHAVTLYQETRLDVEPSSPASIVEFALPAHSANAHAHRPTPKRRRVEKAARVQDEDGFARRHLALESSIHFRRHGDSSKPRANPHSILWRVFDERKVLELQAVDLYGDAADKEQYNITLRFEFHAAIRPKGVAFAETTDGLQGPLVVFVITRLGELYELRLPRIAFSRAGALDEQTVDSSKWFSSDVPNAISYHPPHSFVAKSDKELWASLSDGGLVKLERQQTPEGEIVWHESWFTEGSWVKGFTNFIPWKSASTARFDGVDLNLKTALALAAAPDGRHIWSANLDHTLRAWDVQSGKLVLNLDLAGTPGRDMEKPPERLLDPSQCNILNVVPLQGAGDEYTVVIFSPLTRQFKFWLIRDAASAEHGITDMNYDFDFVPPIEDLLDTNIWTLEAFHVKPFEDGRRTDWTLWMQVRSSSRSYTLNCRFNPRDSASALAKDWRTNWSDVSPGSLAADGLEQALGGPLEWVDDAAYNGPQDLVTRWTDFLFNGSRFAEPILEAALSVYLHSLKRPNRQSSAADKRPLLERVCDTVGSGVVLRRGDDQVPAFDAFYKDVASQWHIFYGVVKDLHKRREAVLSLALDPEHDMPWVVMAGYVSPVRGCAEIDKLCLNRAAYSRPAAISHESSLLHELDSRENSELGGLLHAAKTFRKTMPASFLQAFRFALEVDVLKKSTKPSWDRLSAVYDQAGFDVSNEDYEALLASLDLALGGFSNLSATMINDTIALLGEKQRGNHQKRALTPGGFRALVRAGQEVIQGGLEVLTDLLLLVVFIGVDLEEQDIPRELEPAVTFDALISSYRQYSFLHWLASHSVLLSTGKGLTESDLFSAKSRETSTVTVLEWLFAGDWSGLISPSIGDVDLLTYWSRAWSLGPPLDDAYDELAAHVLARLIQHGDTVLARHFSKFVSNDPWSRYVRARLMLLEGDFVVAAAQLKQIQSDLDGNFAVQEYDRAGLLDLEERSKFGAGPSRFFQHVVALFDKERAMSYVASFAVLGLQALEEESAEGTFKGDVSATRTDLLSRLFTAQVRTSRFEDAFETLTMHTDMALRRASLQAFLSAALAKNQIKLLLSMSTTDDVAEEIDEHLTSMAAKASYEAKAAFGSEGGLPTPQKVLYAWRVSRNNMRGAASCLWDQLQRLRQAQADGFRGQDVEGQIATSYLAIINCLSLVEPEMAWIMVRPPVMVPKPRLGRALAASTEAAQPKRKIVTLEDMRKEWRDELDRIADLEAGRFALPTTAMEIDNEEPAVNGALEGAMEVDVGA